ncbi:MAG TPA: hypothetical protein PL168_01540 [Methanobacterium sp.]|nr:hypothetical protein [Methanobacterium sp.]
MHFIMISKKDSFEDEQLNEQFLSSSNAPSLISREAIKFEISNFIIYIYPYNQIDHETYGYSYYADADRLFLINGIVNTNDNLRNPDICEFFDQINESTELLGDYQLIAIDKGGEGFIKTPPLSVRQLFHYKDEKCEVLSTEIKLIVDGIKKFREKPFVNHFDYDFIEDSVFREWTPRELPQKTIFKEIERVMPYDTKYFKEGKLIIKKKDIEIPQWFKDRYKESKAELFNDYYKSLVNFVESNLIRLKPNIEKICLGLTGGFDSRLSASILSKICKKHNIPFECQTSGQNTHPDVVIAKKVAQVLDVKLTSIKHTDDIVSFPYMGPNTTNYCDYISNFYMAHGDFNSKDYVSTYNRKILNLSLLLMIGMDGYKKDELYKIAYANRWYGRRILFHKNFFFPLFFTEYETWFALLYAENGGEDAFKEFVYEILKRSEPELLTIPFAGDSLPQTDLEPYLKVIDSKIHYKEPFLWDYNLVNMNLKPVLSEKFDELDDDYKSFLKFLGLNELDYFLNEEIDEFIQSHLEEQIDLNELFKVLLNERLSNKYSRSISMIKMTKKNRYPYNYKLQILMDFAVVANYYSFEEIERDLGIKE